MALAVVRFAAQKRHPTGILGVMLCVGGYVGLSTVEDCRWVHFLYVGNVRAAGLAV